MWGWGSAWGDAGGGIMVVVMLVAAALVVVGIVLLVRGISGRDHVRSSASSAPPFGSGSSRALQVLEERYARGEIQREEFLQRKQDLLGGQEAKQ